VRYGVMPRLGSDWGCCYLQQVKDFIANTGFTVFEHDGAGFEF